MAGTSDEKQLTKDQRRAQTKGERAEAARRARQRRTLGYALGAVAAIAALVVIMVALSGGGGGKGDAPSAAGSVDVSSPVRSGLIPQGQRAPSFSAPALGGGRVEWSPGKPSVIALWAPWCPHCRTELPVLGTVADRFPGVQLVTIATAIGQQAGPTVKGYIEDHGLTFPVAIDDSSGTLSSAFGLQYFPTIYFVKSDGTVATALDGEVPEAALTQLFGSLS